MGLPFRGWFSEGVAGVPPLMCLLADSLKEFQCFRRFVYPGHYVFSSYNNHCRGTVTLGGQI